MRKIEIYIVTTDNGNNNLSKIDLDHRGNTGDGLKALKRIKLT
jgi:hypothetical protein